MSRRSSTVSSARARKAGPAGAGGRVLHLDAFSGMAGNMFLAALLELGLPRKALEADLHGLGLDFRLKIQAVRRGALGATYLDVLVPEKSTARRGGVRSRAPRPRHDHDGHGHSQAHGASHDHDHAHDGALVHAPPGQVHAHTHGRPYSEIVSILERATLEAPVRARALAIFEALAHAEARVHRVPIAKVHFHEVGAVDALVDVTGAAIGLHRLGIARVTCSPVALGHGTVETAHGRLPVPVPAALELLRGVPTVPAHVAWETVTPTGAAILRTIVDEYRTMPALTVEAIGHGAGNDRPGPMPNVLRAVLGREPGLGSDRVAVLDTHLDDLIPEHFDFLLERLLEAGALDVSIAHLQMKKNRPGFGVRVIGRPSDRNALARVLFAESSAIGVRVTEADRVVLAREAKSISTKYGRVGVKLVRDGDGRVDVSAEYDDCKRVARARAVPLRDVVRAAEAAARKEWVLD